MSAVATLSAVPTPAGLTPESSPSIAVLSLVRAHREFKALEDWLLNEETGHLPLHEVEREQERFHPSGQWRPVNLVDEK